MIVASWWEPLTAISTLVLASVTAWLAWSTRGLSREARNETRANWLPVLHPIGDSIPGRGTSAQFDSEQKTLTLTVANVGRGPALDARGFLKVKKDLFEYPDDFRASSEEV